VLLIHLAVLRKRGVATASDSAYMSDYIMECNPMRRIVRNGSPNPS